MAKSENPSERLPTTPGTPGTPGPGTPGVPGPGGLPRGDRTDRSRLEQIQQTDITESRLNEDFLDWLKSKGINYAAVILLILVAVMGFNIFKDRRSAERDAAWMDLAGASVPASLEDIAARHPRTDSIAPWALLDAADRYFNSAQRGVRLFDREPDAEDYRLSPDQRQEWFGEADRLYGQIVDISRSGGELERTGFLVAGLFGRAAVAESRGDAAAARGLLNEVIEATRTSHPAIAELAEARLADIDTVVAFSSLPSRIDLPAPATSTPITEPIVTDDFLRDLLTPRDQTTSPPGE